MHMDTLMAAYQGCDAYFSADMITDYLSGLGGIVIDVHAGIAVMINKGWAVDEGRGLYRLTISGEKEAENLGWKKPPSNTPFAR